MVKTVATRSLAVGAALVFVPVVGVVFFRRAKLIEQELASAGGSLTWRGDRSDLAEALEANIRTGDLVLTIGAGDITKTGPELLKRLSEKD